jgi:hypothetical protein
MTSPRCASGHGSQAADLNTSESFDYGHEARFASRVIVAELQGFCTTERVTEHSDSLQMSNVCFHVPYWKRISVSVADSQGWVEWLCGACASSSYIAIRRTTTPDSPEAGFSYIIAPRIPAGMRQK